MAESVTNPQRPPVSGLARRSAPVVRNLCFVQRTNGRKPRAGDYLSGVSRSAFAAFGHQVEENKHNALEKYKGSMC